MKLLPSTGQEWLSSILWPFKAYTFIGFVIYTCCHTGRGHPLAGAIALAATLMMALCVPVLLCGSLMQLFFKPRSAAFSTFALAGADAFLFFVMVPYFVRA